MTSAGSEGIADVDTTKLGNAAARGAASTMVAQAARIGLQVVSIVVLARLLSPEEYGLIAMVTAIIGVGEVFRDFGLSSAAIQARSITRQQRTNLFWVNTSIGALLGTLVLASSHLIAAVYGEERLVAIAQVLAITFVINGLGTQHRADLTRRLRLPLLASIDILSQLLAFGLAAGLALSGAGYWSLVAMQVTQVFLSASAVFVCARWFPGRPRFRGHGMRRFFRYGGGVLGGQLLGYAGKNADSVILGVTLGPESLGLYNRAFQVMTLPLNQLQAPSTRVALPVLSRLQDDQPRFDKYLLTGQMLLLHLTGVILGASAALATPLFAIVLGDGWVEAAPLFQILAISGFAGMANYACYWVFMSTGLTGSFLRLALATRPLMIAALVVGALGGTYGVAWTYSITSVLLWPVTLWWLARASSAPVMGMFKNGVTVIALQGSAVVLSLLAQLTVRDSSEAIILVVGGLVYLLVVAGVALLFRPLRRDMTTLIGLRKSLAKG